MKQLNSSSKINWQALTSLIDLKMIPEAAAREARMKPDIAMYRALWDLGLLNPILPASTGSANLDCVDLCDFFRELARAPLGVATTIIGNLLGSSPLLFAARPGVLNSVTGAYQKAPQFFSFAMTEEAHGFDVASNETVVVPTADGFVINGQKNFITNASIASHFAVFGKLQLPGRLPNLMTCFYVPANTPGLEISANLEKLGHRESVTNHITLRDVHVPNDSLVGEVGQGLTLLGRSLERSKTLLAAVAVGQATEALRLTETTLGERLAQGEPLLHKPVVRAQLARLKTSLEAAWLLAKRSAQLFDQSIPCAVEASQAKLYATDLAQEIISECLELVGARAYLVGHPLERMYRDVKLLEIYEGSTHILEAQIARQVVPFVKRPAAAPARKAS